MFTSIWEDIKQQFSHGNTLTRIILVNIAVFILVLIARLVMGGPEGEAYHKFLYFFAISSDWWENLTHPWTLVTHMFLHEGLWHILWNMLLLYWFGRIVGDLLGDHRILPIYLMSGLAGGLIYFALANALPSLSFGGHALGASAAFMGTITVAGVTAPDYNISLPFLGDVRLKYIVAFLILLDIVALSWNSPNTGGSFGHLGGAAMGYIIASQLQQGNDMTVPVNNIVQKISSFFNSLFTNERPKPKMAYKNPNVKQKQKAQRRSTGRSRGNHSSDSQDLSHQERVDAILEKIKESGYDSLSSEEKEFLFNASKK